jgi:YVTN family beta-propeller protein
VWTANHGSNNVTKINAFSGALVNTHAVGTRPFGIAFDGINIWTANSGSGNVTKLSKANGALVGTFAVPATPMGLAFEQGGSSSGTGTGSKLSDDRGTYIWVTSDATSTVSAINTATGAVVGTYPTGGSPFWPTFDGTSMWVPNNGSFTLSRFAVR